LARPSCCRRFRKRMPAVIKKVLTTLLYVAIIGVMTYVVFFRVLRSCRQFFP